MDWYANIPLAVLFDKVFVRPMGQIRLHTFKVCEAQLMYNPLIFCIMQVEFQEQGQLISPLEPGILMAQLYIRLAIDMTAY